MRFAKRQHRNNLPNLLRNYCKSRTLDYYRYSQYHMRLSDDRSIIDIWTTGKYYVQWTEYGKTTDKPIDERTTEKGLLPANKELEAWLDKFFYAADIDI